MDLVLRVCKKVLEIDSYKKQRRKNKKCIKECIRVRQIRAELNKEKKQIIVKKRAKCKAKKNNIK